MAFTLGDPYQRQMRIAAVISFACLVLMFTPARAQEATPQPVPAPVGTGVSVEATDGRTLAGEYFAPASGGDTPTIFLLHELYTTRLSWSPYIQILLDSGYRVLSVDVRGYGQTRGDINWSQAQDDTQSWLAWLYGQSGVRLDAIFLMGSSMGANLALVGCDNADHCAGAVAVSPGLNYFGVRTSDAITSGMPALLVYADRDGRPARDVPRMLQRAADAGATDVTSIVYAGRDHGMLLFTSFSDLLPQITAWISAHVP